MAHSLTLYFAFICPLDGFRGLYGVSPYLPPLRACTRSTAAFLTVFAPILIFFFIANQSSRLPESPALAVVPGLRSLIDTLI